MMRVSKEAFPAALPFAAIAVAVLVPLFFPARRAVLGTWNFYTAVFLFIVTLWVFWFFRDPDIRIIREDGVLLSPASGRVLEVDDSGSESTQVRIFMNICNYHIQRAPCAGRVISVEHTPGSFANASKKDAHLKNERNRITMETAFGEVGVTQIAGAIARRIVCWEKPGGQVMQGDKLGMIKFGSQVDCSFPKGFEVLVKKGEKVSCAKTKLARWLSD